MLNMLPGCCLWSNAARRAAAMALVGAGFSISGLPVASAQAERPPAVAEGARRVDEASSKTLPRAFSTGASWLRTAIDSMRVESENPLPTPTGPSRLPQATIEIEAARRHQQNLFRGSALESAGGHVDDRAEFSRALKKVAAEHSAAEKAAVPLPVAPAALPATEPLLPATGASTNGDIVGVAQEMRAVAWTLDEMAAGREEEGNYAAADRLRLAAQRIRREARELLHPAAPDARPLHR